MERKIWNLITRYLIIIAVAIPNLWIFYKIFTPLTIYPVYYVLGLIYHVELSGILLTLEGFPLYIIKSCIAGSAYFLLLILNFTTPMNPKKRLFSLLFSFAAFLLINILRIIIFASLFINNFSLFNLTHMFTWYVLSGVFVFAIWIAEVNLFKIKEIPIYSDFKLLYDAKNTQTC